ncbi:tyrosine-type recombinase/integrase [Pseudonocardia acidicola]|uniref:Tyrosine-type recombinase/integrase n=1 Tax=Pseudonocardia acidicola TaxID=2724939 RepID=A0ABX1SGM7_9PSEU|nr:tyrosine-type recombinase/integrase [Pseudonocardia acidicola]NMI00720.1 tyrosine-type recombinase/integrase [Pseudonocardia acidicola]
MDELAEWIEEWRLELESGRVSASTVTVYLRSARQFAAWLAEAHPGLTVEEIDRKVCQGWMRHLAEQGKAEATRRVRGLALGLLLGYVAGEADSGLTTNPAANLELPTPKAPPVPVVSDDDLAALLRACDGASFVDRRDTAIIRLLLDTGMRRAELVGIDVPHVDVRLAEVMITGKGGKARIVPFGNRTALALRKYLRARARRGVGEGGPLFLSIRATPGRGFRMTGGGVADMLKRRCQAAGLSPIHPHQLRHTWAHDMLAAGAGESDVERLAGWSTPMMVRRYGASVADSRSRDVARRLARGDRI